MLDQKDASPLDPVAAACATRLHRRASEQRRAVIGHYLRRLPAWLIGRPVHDLSDMSFFDDKLLSIDASQGELLYVLARARRPGCVVEFGTSYGVSTLYLAAAVRDAGCGGRVVGTELVQAKAERAIESLAEAGLTDHVEVRVGDALRTLAELPGPVDMLLLDGWPGLAGAVLDLVEPRLSSGAVVVLDNVAQFGRELRPVLARLAAKPYVAARLPLNGVTVVAIFES